MRAPTLAIALMLLTGADAAAQGSPADNTGVGLVREVQAEKRQMTIGHAPIATPRMPDMVMAFDIAPGLDITGISPGDVVIFSVAPRDQAAPQLTYIRRAGETGGFPQMRIYGRH